MTKNPPSATVADHHTGRLHVEQVETHAEVIKGDFWQLRLGDKKREKLENLNRSDLTSEVVKAMRLQPKTDPPRTEIGGMFVLDLNAFVDHLSGAALERTRAKGGTLEQVVQKAHSENGEDLKPEVVAGKTYPPSNPHHPDHQEWLEQEAKRRKRSVASLKAAEEKRRQEQAAKKEEE